MCMKKTHDKEIVRRILMAIFKKYAEQLSPIITNVQGTASSFRPGEVYL